MRKRYNEVFAVSSGNSSHFLPSIRARTNNSKYSNNTTEIPTVWFFYLVHIKNKWIKTYTFHFSTLFDFLLKTYSYFFNLMFYFKIYYFYSKQRPNRSWYYSTTSFTLSIMPEYSFLTLFVRLSFDLLDYLRRGSFYGWGLRYAVLFVSDLLGREDCYFFLAHYIFRSLAVLTAPKWGGFRWWCVLNLFIFCSGSSLKCISIFERLGFLIG